MESAANLAKFSDDTCVLKQDSIQVPVSEWKKNQ